MPLPNRQRKPPKGYILRLPIQGLFDAWDWQEAGRIVPGPDGWMFISANAMVTGGGYDAALVGFLVGNEVPTLIDVMSGMGITQMYCSTLEDFVRDATLEATQDRWRLRLDWARWRAPVPEFRDPGRDGLYTVSVYDNHLEDLGKHYAQVRGFRAPWMPAALPHGHDPAVTKES